MIRCGGRGVWRRLSRRWIVPASGSSVRLPTERVATRPYATAHVKRDAQDEHSLGAFASFEVFKHRTPPLPADRDDVRKWAPLLEACLPYHLRSPEHHHTTVMLDNTKEKAEVLVAARRRPASNEGADLLYDLGMVQGRWKAAVWLIKELVDHSGSTSQQPPQLPTSQAPWNGQDSLDKLTNEPINLQLPQGSAVQPQVYPDWPRMILSERKYGQPELSDMEQRKSLRRNILGVIWRSLGAMIVACADGAIRPEILEMVAHLHYQGIMPASIYSRKPREDETAIQQPPTLHLLSSRILTSLSDAAWRAHEQVIVDETRAKGGNYVPVRPEIPGTAYRVHVAGLRPELWLELVLWACLHGGWVLEGVAILTSVCKQPKAAWKPISWRSLMPHGKGSLEDWDKLDYIFNTRSPKTMDQEPTVHEVKRTVSSEVVNAYVDALLSEVDTRFHDRAAPPQYVLAHLNIFRGFLDRSGLKLGGGSWDAVVLRFFESAGAAATRPMALLQLIALSPGFGGEVTSSNTQTLPPYVLDGSAAMIGIAHQALRTQIKAGDVGHALRVFRHLQAYTDANKRSSLEEFFASPRQNAKSKRRGLFTSIYDAIDYPAFDIQLPPTILGPFLDLVTGAEAYDFGKWLFYSREVDGPLIPESLYNDPAIAPVVVRFATATNDKTLLSKLIQSQAREDTETGERPGLPQNLLQSFLSAQLALRRWSAAERILQALAESEDSGWNIVNLAVLSRTMMVLGRQEAASDDKDLTEAKRLFSAMVTGEYNSKRGTDHSMLEQLLSLLTVVSVSDVQWASFCCSVKELRGHFIFNLPAKAFNEVLAGVLEIHGTVAARRLLTLFWPRAVRRAQAREHGLSDSLDKRKWPRGQPGTLTSVERHRTPVQLPGQDGRSVVVYGGLRPDLTSVRMIFRKVLEELKHEAALGSTPLSDLLDRDLMFDRNEETTSGLATRAPRAPNNTPTGMVTWSIRQLRDLGMAEEDIREELDAALQESQPNYPHAQASRLSEMRQRSDAAELDQG